MNMQSRIELELRGKEAATIRELNLDNCRATKIEGLTNEFQQLEVLSMINIGLTTLKGFPKLANLRKLELSDNRILNGLENLLGCSNLTHLNLSNNKIKELEELKTLAQLEHLSHLDLFNCEVTQEAEYRQKVFDMIPHLKYLDSFDKNEREAVDEEDEDDDDDDEDEEEEDDDEEEDEDDDEDEDESEGDGETDVGLSYLQKSNLPEEEDDADFDVQKAIEKHGGEEDDDDEEEEEDDEEVEEVGEEDLEAGEAAAAGDRKVSLKRKHEEENSNDA